MKNVKTPETASVVFFDETVGVSKKCSDDWKLVRSAAFSKKGTLSLSAASFPFPRDFQVGFFWLSNDGVDWNALKLQSMA